MSFTTSVQCPRCYKESQEDSEKESNGFPVYKLCVNCVESIKQKWINKINSTGIEIERFTFDKFIISKENNKAVEICKKFANREIDRFGLWLYSLNTGNGKTHLSYAVLKQWILSKYIPIIDSNTHHIPCPYAVTTEPDLLLRIRSTYKDNSGEDENNILDEYKNVEFLIIDDLGKTNANDLSFMQRTMYTIIDYRYLRHKLTIVSSNKNGAELQQYLGLYTFDRLKGMSERVTEIHGESYRGKHG
jgi:DNA replication protein DnaC